MKGDFDLTNSKYFLCKSAVLLKMSRQDTLASAKLSEMLLEAVQEGAETGQWE